MAEEWLTDRKCKVLFSAVPVANLRYMQNGLKPVHNLSSELFE